MKIVGILVILAGWLLPVVGLTMTQSMAARFVLVFLGIGIILVGILGVLNKAHLKEAIWKKA
ncbi:MAG TPA: hypothetical protein VLV49_05650 [Terriglobales bacterium]|nr:hypothetical protein [Terriglobales bacterium]